MSEQDSDQQLADRLDAQDRLIERGYTRRSCQTCGGVGQIFIEHMNVMTGCYSCKGRGFHWYAPLMK